MSLHVRTNWLCGEIAIVRHYRDGSSQVQPVSTWPETFRHLVRSGALTTQQHTLAIRQLTNEAEGLTKILMELGLDVGLTEHLS